MAPSHFVLSSLRFSSRILADLPVVLSYLLFLLCSCKELRVFRVPGGNSFEIIIVSNIENLSLKLESSGHLSFFVRFAFLLLYFPSLLLSSLTVLFTLFYLLFPFSSRPLLLFHIVFHLFFCKELRAAAINNCESLFHGETTFKVRTLYVSLAAPSI